MKTVYEGIRGDSVVPEYLLERLFQLPMHQTRLGDINTDTRTPEYRGLDEFYKLVRSKGLKVNEVPHDYMQRRFGDCVGWREGDEIYVSLDYKGRLLTSDEKMAIAGHEYMAGSNHLLSDKEAQKGAINLFSPNGEFPYYFAQTEAVKMGRIFEGDKK